MKLRTIALGAISSALRDVVSGRSNPVDRSSSPSSKAAIPIGTLNAITSIANRPIRLASSASR